MCKSDEAATCVHNAAVSLARVAADRRNWAALWCGHLSGSASWCLWGRSVLLCAHQSSWSQMFPFLGWDCGADQSFYRPLCVFSLAAERLVQLIKPHPHQPMHANAAWQWSSIWFSGRWTSFPVINHFFHKIHAIYIPIPNLMSSHFNYSSTKLQKPRKNLIMTWKKRKAGNMHIMHKCLQPFYILCCCFSGHSGDFFKLFSSSDYVKHLKLM